MIRFSDGEFARLVSYVGLHYGIDLSKKRTLAECRLHAELDRWKIPSLTEFLDRLETDKTGRLAAGMIDRLATNYTFFLRESSHFDYLEQEILPRLPADAHSYEVWCAGCSTGEECYTLAMLLSAYRDGGGRLPPPHILATDISETALRRAEAGRYSAAAVEKLPAGWRRAYCRPDGCGSFVMREDIRRMITFKKMNLMRPFAGHARYDLALCRNVMIYFNETARKRLADRLALSLKGGGYLFIGHTELLPRGQNSFTYIRPAIYQKAGERKHERDPNGADGGIG